MFAPGWITTLLEGEASTLALPALFMRVLTTSSLWSSTHLAVCLNKASSIDKSVMGHINHVNLIDDNQLPLQIGPIKGIKANNKNYASTNYS